MDLEAPARKHLFSKIEYIGQVEESKKRKTGTFVADISWITPEKTHLQISESFIELQPSVRKTGTAVLFTQLEKNQHGSTRCSHMIQLRVE